MDSDQKRYWYAVIVPIGLAGIGLGMTGVAQHDLGWAIVGVSAFAFIWISEPHRAYRFYRSRIRWHLNGRPVPGGDSGILAIPGSSVGARDIRFTTDNRQRRILTTSPNPRGIRFSEPMRQSVSGAPASVRCCGVKVFDIDQFSADGIVISHQRPGIDVEAEVSY